MDPAAATGGGLSDAVEELRVQLEALLMIWELCRDYPGSPIWLSSGKWLKLYRDP